jgi:hypothetical protein
MIYKELKSDNKKVQIFRQKNRLSNGYEYFIHVLSKGLFGAWFIDDRYKQKLSINSKKQAFIVANNFLNTEI